MPTRQTHKNNSKAKPPFLGAKSDFRQSATSEGRVVINEDCSKILQSSNDKLKFDLVLTSPPYNIGKKYERRVSLSRYLEWQELIIELVTTRVQDNGSVCWQVGNYVENGFIEPLDIWIHPVFLRLGMKLRNRIVWRFGHGLHCKRRFSGRYEVVMWYTKTDDYVFNLDAVRMPAKYPGKRYYKGPRAGELSSDPRGKNPEDVWDIPNVKGNHCEKTSHPCQFPVGLAERLILSLTNQDGLVFDPFAGVCSTGVAAALHQRKFIGCEINSRYSRLGLNRIQDAENGRAIYRPHDQPLYDHNMSPLSIRPSA